LGNITACTSKNDPKPANTSSNTTTTPSGTVLLTLDLNETSNSALKTNGNYIIKNNIVIARTNNGNFVAVENLCSHESQRTITFSSSENNFECSTHGAKFSTNGTGLNAFGSKGIKVYSTKLDGNTLTITS
jgi:nitrite reductase/ring-hydroxylating ferredoxin subunit